MLTTFLSATLLAPQLDGDPFNVARALDIGPFFYARESGHFDDDGLLDLMVLNDSSSFGELHTYLYRNEGDRSFELFHDFEPDAFNEGIIDANRREVADLNGDGLDDLVYVLGSFDLTQAELRIFLNPGNGLFAVPTDVDVGVQSIQEILPIDREGDGDEELVVLATDGAFQQQVFWVDFDGGAFVKGTPWILPANSIARARVGDLSGDGVADVAALSTTWDAVLLFQTVGDALVPGPTQELPTPLFGNINMDMVVMDLEPDGDVDLLPYRRPAGGTPPAGLTFAGLQNDGSGVFTALPLQELEAGVDLLEVQLGDWDGDGDLELMDGWYDITIVENLGTGQFGEIFTVNAELGGTPAGPDDFDGDGSLDFAANSCVYYGDGTFAGLGVGLSAGKQAPSNEPNDLLLDFDGDGDLDLLDPVAPRWAPGDGSGNVGNWLYRLPLPPADHVYGTTVGRGDFDGDGHEDFVAGLFEPIGSFESIYKGLRFLKGNAYGSSADVGPAAHEELVMVFLTTAPGLALDVDDDGDADMVVRDGFHPNVGTNAPSFTDFVAADWNIPIRVLDVDQDGDDDLLAYSLSELYLYENQGGGSFVETFLTTYDTDDVLRTLDVDADGDEDLVLLGQGGDELTVWENVPGGGGRTAHYTDPVHFGHEAFDVGVTDLDEDGWPDLLILRDPDDNGLVGHRATWLRRDPLAFHFEPQVSWLAGGATRVGDLDTDGDVDLFGGVFSTQSWVENLTVTGTASGSIQQFGSGTPGTGGVPPVLGTKGPVTAGSQPELRLVHGVGGAPAFLVASFGEGQLVDFPAPGLTLYLDPAFLSDLILIPLDGTPGEPGDGSFSIDYTVGPGLQGLTWYQQVFVIDLASPSLLAQSNGLELTFGT